MPSLPRSTPHLGGQSEQEYAELTGVQPGNDWELHVDLHSCVSLSGTIATRVTHNIFDSIEIVSTRQPFEDPDLVRHQQIDSICSDSALAGLGTPGRRLEIRGRSSPRAKIFSRSVTGLDGRGGSGRLIAWRRRRAGDSQDIRRVRHDADIGHSWTALHLCLARGRCRLVRRVSRRSRDREP